MRVRRPLLVLAMVGGLALAACEKTAEAPERAGAEAAKAFESPGTATGETSAPVAATDPAPAGPMGPRDIADALRKTQMPTGAEGFSFPNPPTCNDAGPSDRFVTRCGFDVKDDQGHGAGIVAVELYDHDLDFETQANMLKTMVQGLSTNTIASIDPTFGFRPAGGSRVSIRASCAQPLEPRGPAFCMAVLPNRRTLLLTMVKPTPGSQSMEEDIDRAKSLSMMAMGLMPGRSMSP